MLFNFINVIIYYYYTNLISNNTLVMIIKTEWIYLSGYQASE